MSTRGSYISTKVMGVKSFTLSHPFIQKILQHLLSIIDYKHHIIFCIALKTQFCKIFWDERVAEDDASDPQDFNSYWLTLFELDYHKQWIISTYDSEHQNSLV